MKETLSAAEIEFLYKFCDKYSAETKGRPLVNRIDDVNNKLQSLFIGVGQLVGQTKRHFPSLISDN